MTTKYLTVLILDPKTMDTDAKQDKMKKTILTYFLDNSATKIYIDNTIGKRELAYPIKGYTRGYYLQIYWQYDSTDTPYSPVTMIESQLRIDTTVLKFISIKIDPDADDYKYDETHKNEVVSSLTGEHLKPTPVDALDIIYGLIK